MSSTIKRRSTPNTRGEQNAYDTASYCPSDTIVIDVKPHTPVQKHMPYVPVIVSGHQQPCAGIVIQSPGGIQGIVTPHAVVHQVATPYGVHAVASPYGVHQVAVPYGVVHQVGTPHVVIPVQPKFQIGYPPHFIRY